MWGQILGTAFGQNKAAVLAVPELPDEKTDYTTAIVAGFAVIAVLAVFYFIFTAKK